MATNSNTHPAIEFLKKLDLSPDSTFNIEHYTDLPKGIPKPKPDPLAGRYANLSMHDVEELLTKLQSYNDKGAGIFVARNQCNGHRSEKNIMRVRGIHADMDDVTSTQLAAVINHLKPSIIVQSSSPNRCQLYWQLAEAEDMSKEEAKSINQCLAQIHGADPAAVDVSRLLRLPGFKHMKYRMKGIKPAVTVNSIGPTYTADEIRNAFQPIKGTAKKKKTAPSANPGGIVNSNHLTENLENVAKTVSAKYPSLWAGDWESVIRSSGEIGYESKSEADLALAGHIARAMRDYEINTDAMAETLVAIFNSSFLGKSDKWQQREDYRMRTVDKALSSLCESSSYADQNELMLESHGDVRNSKAFAQITRGTFIHVTTRDRWLRWDLEQWRLCEKEEHVAKAKEVCGQILTTASQIFSHDSDRGRKLLQDAMAAHSLPRIMAMLKLAVSEPDMSTTDRELDSDPYLLGVKNGLIDLLPKCMKWYTQ